MPTPSITTMSPGNWPQVLQDGSIRPMGSRQPEDRTRGRAWKPSLQRTYGCHGTFDGQSSPNQQVDTAQNLSRILVITDHVAYARIEK